MKPTKKLLLLVLVGLLACAKSKIVTCDQENAIALEECIKRTPQCLEYEYVPDTKNPGRYFVTCNQCQEGLVPGWTYQAVEIDEFTELPAQPLYMCGPNPNGNPVSCTSITCFFGPLKFCNQYQLTSPEYGRPGVFRGLINCLDCMELYEPVPGGIWMVYDADNGQAGTQTVCSRKEGIFSCGHYCQAEFPGCARIQISKVKGGRDTGLQETAGFRCIEALPGYNLIFQTSTATTLFFVPKVTVFPAYESEVLDCNTKLCQAVLPNCEAYYTVSSESFDLDYYCKRCKTTMVPLSAGSRGLPLVNALQKKAVYQVCQQQKLEPTPCDSRCKFEFPGCDVVAVPTVTQHYDQVMAVYQCLKCADGFDAAPDDNFTPSWIQGSASRNTKIRCVPKQVLEPTPVSGEMTLILPKCLKYTARFRPDSPNNAMEYTCHQCEQGWEPTSAPVYAEWHTKSERTVCKHIPFPAPVQCNDECKQVFPDCDRVMVSKDPKGHNIYECLQCSNGFYPIPYEREASGRLAFEDHKMREHTKLLLCSDQPKERYFSVVTCDSHNLYGDEEEGCLIDQNCRLGVEAKSELRAIPYFKCLECADGYRLKKGSQPMFIGDPVRCERASETLLG